MKTYSPIRPQIHYFDHTPQKVQVECEINSWMETYIKKRRASQPARLPVLTTPQHTLASLRQRRNILLQQTLVMKKSNLRTTACNSRSSSNNSLDKSLNQRKKYPQVQKIVVSEFDCKQSHQKKATTRRLLKLIRQKNDKATVSENIVQIKITANQYRGLKLMNKKITLAKQP